MTAAVVWACTLPGPFRHVIAMTPQLLMNAAMTRGQPAAFAPRHRGTFSPAYVFTWSDVTGTPSVKVHMSGKGVCRLARSRRVPGGRRPYHGDGDRPLPGSGDPGDSLLPVGAKLPVGANI